MIMLNVYLKIISASLNYPEGIVKHADRYTNADDVLRLADLVIYGSFLEEPSFPDILIKAMSFEKLIIAPNLSMIQKYVRNLHSLLSMVVLINFNLLRSLRSCLRITCR